MDQVEQLELLADNTEASIVIALAAMVRIQVVVADCSCLEPASNWDSGLACLYGMFIKK